MSRRAAWWTASGALVAASAFAWSRGLVRALDGTGPGSTDAWMGLALASLAAAAGAFVVGWRAR